MAAEMSVNFQPDQVTFGDLAGYGYWDDGHAREHLAFETAFAGQTPAVALPSPDLLTFLASGPARKSVLQSHSDAHKLLRPLCGITGVDLSAVDLENESGFYDWLGYHAQEHAQIRQFLGMT